MFSAMMFALKQIGDHSLQAKKIWHKKHLLFAKKSAFLHFIVYLIIFLYTQKKISSSKSGSILRPSQSMHSDFRLLKKKNIFRHSWQRHSDFRLLMKKYF